MEYFDVGKILATHGLSGEVKVLPITDFPEERFAPGSKLELQDNHNFELIVRNSRPFKNFFLVQFEEITDIDAAENIVGKTLVVSQEDQSKLADNSHYYHEIIGLDAFDNITGKYIGKVADIEAPGANDIWRIDPEIGKAFWIPNIASVVKKIDIANNKVYLELIEGLRDEN